MSTRWLRPCAAILILGLVDVATAAPAADAAPSIRWVPAAVTANGKPAGYVLFQNDCGVCHGDGPAKPGTRALRAKYGGKLPALLEERKDLTPALIKAMVRQGVSVMPPFRKTEVSDAELDAIVTYLTRRQ